VGPGGNGRRTFTGAIFPIPHLLSAIHGTGCGTGSLLYQNVAVAYAALDTMDQVVQSVE